MSPARYGCSGSDDRQPTLALLRSSSLDSTSIDALQAFIVITAVPVTPMILSTLWMAPRLAWLEHRRLGNASQTRQV